MSKSSNKAFSHYIVLPLIFLAVIFFGGLRIARETHDFLFLKPALITLVLAALLLVSVVKSHLIQLKIWISNDFPLLQNISNGLILFLLFAASVQIFNSVLPEKGLFFGITAFFFLWTLWTNIFAQFDATKLFRSLAAIFGFAFIFKFIFLANLNFGGNESWASKIFGTVLEGISPVSLAIPQFAEISGFISFFTLALFAIGLFIIQKENPANQTDSPETK